MNRRSAMYIFEITKPGTWLEAGDREWSREIEKILKGLEEQFYEANLALNMFLDTISISRDRSNYSRKQREADMNRRTEIGKEIKAKYVDHYNHQNWDEISFQTEVRFKREQWQQGRMPREFEHNQAFMHARSFLYALDSFEKFLKVLKSQPNVSEKISELYKRFGKSFPNLRGVRNTAQHMEYRYRGLGAERNPKPLELKPIDNQMIKAKGGTLVLNCLNVTKYGNTMANGHYGEVDVSPKSMESLRSIFQDILDSFQWKGPKNHLPSI